ncbi:Hypothetical predicted protein [Mytilus galloprovincialis]|uniref:DNA2/NAM7 helicase-like C-terminal domain-containing protein n=1 Tax=Mytilus galloprovincialis TaxID=29158 RepID=A0A8B6DV28_MYTGA|nr:Hypothetical predicted protein [Mytilus galloprovincialis]
MYGSTIEQISFPIPGRASVTRSNISDAKADPFLVDHGAVLHHIARQDEKPYASRLREIEKHFSDDVRMLEETVKRNGKPLKTTVEEINAYKDIKSKATKEELPQYDCGMCSEPSTIVPIIATSRKQIILIGDDKQLLLIIKCKEAAKLGLETSLFERYLGNIQSKTMLQEQYRMHPKICKFPSEHFYDGELKTHPKVGISPQPLKMWPRMPDGYYPHVFYQVEGDERLKPMLEMNSPGSTTLKLNKW